MSGAQTMQALRPLAEGLLTADEARALVAGLPRDLDGPEAAMLYGALRAWTWKALDQRRRDGELREWADLIRRARVRVKGERARYHQLETLAELLAESVAVAVRLPLAEVLAKRHAPEILAALHSAGDRPVAKRELMDQLGLEQSNLWRVMRLLEPAGLVEIEKNGRETHYRLSRSGRAEAERLLGTQAPPVTGAELEELLAEPEPVDVADPAIVTSLESELAPFEDDDGDSFQKLLRDLVAEAHYGMASVDEKEGMAIFASLMNPRTVVANENEPLPNSHRPTRSYASA